MSVCHGGTVRGTESAEDRLIKKITKDPLEQLLLMMVVHNESESMSFPRFTAEKKFVDLMLLSGSDRPLTMSVGICQTQLPPLSVMLDNMEDQVFAECRCTKKDLKAFITEQKLNTIQDLLFRYLKNTPVPDQRARVFVRLAQVYAKRLNNDPEFSIREALRRLEENRVIFNDYLRLSGEKYEPFSSEYQAVLLMTYNRSPVRVLSGAYQRWAQDVDQYMNGGNRTRGRSIADGKLPVHNEFKMFYAFARKYPEYFRKCSTKWDDEKEWTIYSRKRQEFLRSDLYKAFKKAYQEKIGKPLSIIPTWDELMKEDITYANYGVRGVNWLRHKK